MGLSEVAGVGRQEVPCLSLIGIGIGIGEMDDGQAKPRFTSAGSIESAFGRKKPPRTMRAT